MPRLPLRLHGLAAIALALLCAGCWNGVVRISGEVVDAETGAALSDVRMKVRTARFSLFARDFAAVSESEERVAGRFRAGCWRCAHVELRFFREGYHDDVVEIVLEPGGARWRQEAVRVALRSAAEAVRLEQVAGSLSVSAAGPVVLPVALGSVVHAVPLAALGAAAERAERPDATVHVRLRVETDASGAPLVAPERPPGVTHTVPLPVSPRLDFGADGGAIAYTPHERRHQAIRREMREAPAGGYARELPLDLTSDGTRWFFCRIGGRYCRGSVNPVIVARTSEGLRAEVHVSLEFNPDGSQNLDPID